MLLFQQLVQLSEAIVRHRGKQMVGDVHVLPVDEDRPAREEIGEEHPRVGQAAVVGVGVLVHVAEKHEEHE